MRGRGGLCIRCYTLIPTATRSLLLSSFPWKHKYGGMEVSDARRLRALEDENRRLKKLVADLALDNAALKDVLSKNW